MGCRDVLIVRPRDFEDLLTEEAFDHEELLPYWAHLWDSAVALAQVVSREAPAGARVLELGCGLGLPSIAAARAGALVTAIDWSPDAIRASSANAARNDVEVEAFTCDWDASERLLDRAPWDLVIAADVLYERKKVTAMLDLLPRLGDHVLLAEPGRMPSEPFFEQAEKDWHRDELRAASRPRAPVHRLRRRPGVLAARAEK